LAAGWPEPPGEFTRLDRAESLRLLSRVPAGRLIFTMDALPAVRLVNFAVASEVIVIRTAAGSTIARKIDHAIAREELSPQRYEQEAALNLPDLSGTWMPATRWTWRVPAVDLACTWGEASFRSRADAPACC
jgi:hypothetical protein